ncbi:hypothetical protein BDN71DRAFT_1570031 [Pleurotus eryngii]|uniref:Uncharacterized protein n=1 Tax=Pleurotus eryngii TaxID=5323 RepID=A0A9P5ZVY0_PLEER|nr:hypothetical protein BDN71DRAFT_1570031 [Pleurotus eryngii]
MSSNEDEGDGSSYLQNAKKRRIQRACDICRRKKSDGSQMPGNQCSNCIAYSFECSYVEAAKKRGPPKGYVESLENRLEKMEKLLRRLYPDGDFSKDLDQLLETSGEVGTPICVPTPPDPNPAKTPTEFASSVIRTLGEIQSKTIIPDDDDDLGHVLKGDLGLDIADQVRNRFFGKSSGATLLQTAMDLKDEYTGQPKRSFPHPNILSRKRDEFWSRPDWEPFVSEPKNPDYIFPDPDLIPPLVDAYFKYYNAFFPLLHRPTFERGMAEGLHLTNDTFAAVVLLVCANGARYSNDPRVLLEGNSPHSSGWKWFTQIQMVRKSLLSPPTLYDLQFYCLTVHFLQGSSAPHACWIMVGIGIRLAQDVGAHRRKAHTHKLSVEDELWKRAFWSVVLVTMDRVISTILGRPVAIQDEDFDLDLPMEVDDEYWEHPDPNQAFKQPPNKPSLVTFFNCYLRLNQVLGIALRTIYSINKSKILLGFVGAQWEQQIVAELDSALNKWVDSVPDHLRWDPNREDLDFFRQSAVLYTHYYYLQILIHRPFIRKPSPLAFPSMAICTNAARTCSHIVDINSRRCPEPQQNLMYAAFTAGVVLLLNIWAGKRSGLTTDPKKEMADVHKCMQMLRSSEERQVLYRIPSAGRLWDILYELACVGDLPLPQASPAPNKRERGSDSPASSTTEDARVTMSPPDKPRSLAGSRRIASKDPISLSSRGMSTIGLPIHSEELGRLPLHGEADFNSLIRTDNDMQAGSSNANANANANGFWYPSFAPQPPNTPGPSSNLGPIPSGELSLTDQTMYEQLMMTTMRMPYNQQYQQPLSDPTLLNSRTHDPQMMQNSPPMPQQMTLDPDTIAMWTSAPSGFE